MRELILLLTIIVDKFLLIIIYFTYTQMNDENELVAFSATIRTKGELHRFMN